MHLVSHRIVRMRPENYKYVPTCVAINCAGKTRAEDGQTVKYSLNVLFYPLETTRFRRFLERNEEGGSYDKRFTTGYLKYAALIFNFWNLKLNVIYLKPK